MGKTISKKKAQATKNANATWIKFKVACAINRRWFCYSTVFGVSVKRLWRSCVKS